MLAASQVSRPSGKLPLVIDEHPPVAVLVNDTVPPVTRYVPPHLPRASRALCSLNVRPRTVHASVRPGTRRVPFAVPTYDLANLGPSAVLEPASAVPDVVTTASTAIVVPVVSMFRITVSPRSLGGRPDPRFTGGTWQCGRPGPGGAARRTRWSLRSERGAARLVRALEDLLDREAAQLLRQDLDPPRTGVPGVAHGRDVLADRELALAGQRAMVDRLVDGVVHVLPLAVAQLDPGEMARRHAAELVGG